MIIPVFSAQREVDACWYEVVSEGDFWLVTDASSYSCMVELEILNGGRHMAGQAVNRDAIMPNLNQYYKMMMTDWISPRVAESSSHHENAIKLAQKISSAIKTNDKETFQFEAPNAGFDIYAKFEHAFERPGNFKSQMVLMLRQQVDSEDDFKKLQATLDPATNRPYISPKAEWEGEGKYPVGAMMARKTYTNYKYDVPPPIALNPYDYVDDPKRFSDNQPGGKTPPKAVVEAFGFRKNQPTVAHTQGEVEHRESFPEVQSPSALSRVFGSATSTLGGGQQQRRNGALDRPLITTPIGRVSGGDVLNAGGAVIKGIGSLFDGLTGDKPAESPADAQPQKAKPARRPD